MLALTCALTGLAGARGLAFTGASTPDRTGELQALIDRTPAGGELIIPAGVWPISQIRLDRPGVRIRGTKSDTVLRALDPRRDLILVGATGNHIRGLRLECGGRHAYPDTFAIRTTGRATKLFVAGVTFGGTDAAAGFTNGIKLDDGAAEARVEGCNFAPLWGTESGSGYCILCSSDNVRIRSNRGTALRGRGRHFVYLTAGASGGIVEDNDCVGFEFEALTVYARAHQRPCVGNRILRNRVRGCARSARLDVASISLFANVHDAVIEGNIIEDSGGCGISLNGSNSSRFANIRVEDNQVLHSGLIGIDVMALDGGTIAGNVVTESSQVAPGTYSNIRLVSDGKRPTRSILVESNRSTGRRFARSPFQINSTPPLPTRITLRNNLFERGSLTSEELSGVRTLR